VTLRRGSAEEAVLQEAAKWFLSVLRKEQLDPHERGLFEAIANLRLAQKAMRDFPGPPPLPNIKGPFPETLKGFPKIQNEPERHDDLESTTRPVPPEVQEDLILESVLDVLTVEKEE
jgi:hypothetical protein